MRIIITEEQEHLLLKNLPIAFRRRLSGENSIKHHLDYGVLEHLNPCEWNDVGHFIDDVCYTVVEELIDYHHQDTGDKFSTKEINGFFTFCVGTYGDYIKEFYEHNCT